MHSATQSDRQTVRGELINMRDIKINNNDVKIKALSSLTYAIESGAQMPQNWNAMEYGTA